METNNMDIIYTLKVKPNHDEIKYSLRSLKNLPHKQVWIFGDCPDWVNHDTVNCVEHNQAKGNKWLNVSDMLGQIVQNENVSENFIWFHDDFFVLNKVDKLEYYYDRTLTVRVTDFYKLGWGRMNTGYTRRLQTAARALKWQKKPILNYELHIPIIFNKEKLAKIMKDFPNVGAKRSLYGNCYIEDAVERKDCKIYNNLDKPEEDWDFVSTSDNSFLEGEVGKYIKRKFRSKSEYERD